MQFPSDIATPTEVREYIAWLLEHRQEYSKEEAEEVANKWQKRMGHELIGLSEDELGVVLGPEHIRGLLFVRTNVAKSRQIERPAALPAPLPTPYKSSGFFGFLKSLFVGGICIIVLFAWTNNVLIGLAAVASASQPKSSQPKSRW